MKTMADILSAVRAERDRVDELVPMTGEDLRGQRYTIEQLNVAARAVGLFGHMQAGLGSAVDAMQEFNRAMAALGPVVEQLCGTLGEVAGVLDQDEAPPKEVEQRFGPVGDRLRRRLDRGRR